MSRKLAKWLAKWIIKSSINDSHIDYWMDKVETWSRTRGLLDTVKRIKLIRLHCTKYLCSEPLLQSIPSIGLTNDGIPRDLGPMVPIIRNPSNNDIRLLLTLLSVSRVIEVQGQVSYSDILDSGPEVSGALVAEFVKVISHLKLNKLDRPQWTKCHLSTKAGPNAQAMLGSIVDLHLLPESLVKDLSIVGGPELKSRIQLLRESFSQRAWEEKFNIRCMHLIRKLSIVHAPEAKERVIAIFDYWSQTALKPLHDRIFTILRGMKGDCTFDQQSSSRWLKVPGPYYSLDLHAATDRFPVKLQEAILAEIVDEEYASAWRSIMVEHEFARPDSPVPIKYGVGQGMGAYSSWAMFALSHHLLIRVAAVRAGYTASWSNYCLLGDDLVLTNSKVVREYLTIMNELGVEINSDKSHTSKSMYEFAKRWYKDGEEVSGFPLRGICEGYQHWYTLAAELQDGLSRMSFSPLEVESRAWTELHQRLGTRIRDTKKMITFWNFPRVADTTEIRESKAYNLTSLLFSGVLGCNQTRAFRYLFVTQTIAEVKTALLEKALKKIAQQLHGFNQKLPELLSQSMGGQSALVALPYVEVVTEYTRELQTSYDALRTAYWDLDEDIIFNEIPIRGVDPIRIESQRVSRVALLTKTSTVNRYSMWSLDYKATRAALLAGTYEAKINES